MKKKNKNNNPSTSKNKKFIEEKARSLPIGKCYISRGWKEIGIAEIIITRIRPSGNLIAGFYLVDIFCLGLKETFCRENVSPSSISQLYEIMRGFE